MAGRNPSPKLNTSLLIEIDNLFTSKNWSKATYQSSKSQYERFCERISIFNPTEQAFFLELSRRFHQILLKDYVTCLWNAYKNIPKEFLKSRDKIFFVPLLEILPNGDKKNKETKSSSALHYYLKGDSYDWVEFHELFYFYDNIGQVKEDFTEHSLIVFVDDFIGSGKTAVDAIRSHQIFIPSLNSKNMVVLTMVSQKGGKEKVEKDIGCSVKSHFVFGKAISDYYKSENLKTKLDLMQSMEDKISLSIKKNGYNLGFEQCEALVSFASRPPNNTLPSFWYETDIKMAPFPRYRNFKQNQQ